MKNVMTRIKDTIEDKEEELAKKELNDNDWIDPTPDLIEGIFHVN